jgi:hypothetical protein
VPYTAADERHRPRLLPAECVLRWRRRLPGACCSADAPAARPSRPARCSCSRYASCRCMQARLWHCSGVAMRARVKVTGEKRGALLRVAGQREAPGQAPALALLLSRVGRRAPLLPRRPGLKELHKAREELSERLLAVLYRHTPAAASCVGNDTHACAMQRSTATGKRQRDACI